MGIPVDRVAEIQRIAQEPVSLQAPIGEEDSDLGDFIEDADAVVPMEAAAFMMLQDQLEGTENRIATAREDYNNAVRAYNAYIRQFPQVLTAKVIGSKQREYFEVTNPKAEEAPKVEFTR